jgi:hypothetical protein
MASLWSSLCYVVIVIFIMSSLLFLSCRLCRFCSVVIVININSNINININININLTFVNQNLNNLKLPCCLAEELKRKINLFWFQKAFNLLPDLIELLI